ncbi:PREDICTED: probable receptor-like protein kinase At5g20050 [Ipomoea nil]|uniref:probable receptor-like protein kinase At5g20050 n=1 Tax=Ipomoea nil TaxID=35883 RepID=UPI000901E1C0|nr:PREDICTED: probable receptor-like protein kinase At5g20050 [Ipomoea nil]
MEDRKAHTIAISLVVILIIVVIVARLILNLTGPFYFLCGADVAAILAVVAVVVIRLRFRSRRQQLEQQLDAEGRELRIEYSFLRKVAGVPTKFRYQELENATDGFRALVGKGSSGSVFMGVLPDGTPVAVKRIEGEERGEREFRSEVAAIASVQHVNLVRLLGYCSALPSGPRFLVYDYISNGSLDNWIFTKRNPQLQARKTGCLSWELRFRAAIDVARALSYLHHNCRSRILHLDIKPENILLDADHRAMVTDFGLAKIMGRDESRVVTTIRGTRGYLAPEWLLENGISEKCDVYSYGMVALEMIGGRRNVSVIKDPTSKKKFQFFPQMVSEKLREGKIMEIVDQRVVEMGMVEERQVEKLASVALWCIQERAGLRPSMTAVVEMLQGRDAVEPPPESSMFIVDLLSNDEDGVDPRRPRLGALQVAQVDCDNNSPSIAFSCGISVLSGR